MEEIQRNRKFYRIVKNKLGCKTWEKSQKESWGIKNIWMNCKVYLENAIVLNTFQENPDEIISGNPEGILEETNGGI